MRTHRHADGSLRSDADETPTQRLYTLRRLLKGTAPPLIFDESTPLEMVERALLASPSSLAVVVDASNSLCGVFSRSERGTSCTSTRAVILEPETEVEGASHTMDTEHVEHVLVVTSAGELLGVVSRRDIDRHHHERRGATGARPR
jgi:CBS domain-containing protein